MAISRYREMTSKMFDQHVRMGEIADIMNEDIDRALGICAVPKASEIEPGLEEECDPQERYDYFMKMRTNGENN